MFVKGFINSNWVTRRKKHYKAFKYSALSRYVNHGSLVHEKMRTKEIFLKIQKHRLIKCMIFFYLGN